MHLCLFNGRPGFMVFMGHEFENFGIGQIKFCLRQVCFKLQHTLERPVNCVVISDGLPIVSRLGVFICSRGAGFLPSLVKRVLPLFLSARLFQSGLRPFLSMLFSFLGPPPPAPVHDVLTRPPPALGNFSQNEHSGAGMFPCLAKGFPGLGH